MKKEKKRKKETVENIIERKNNRKKREKKSNNDNKSNEILGTLINLDDMARELGLGLLEVKKYIEVLADSGKMRYEAKNDVEYYAVDLYEIDEHTGEEVRRKESDVDRDMRTLKRLDGGDNYGNTFKTIYS